MYLCIVLFHHLFKFFFFSPVGTESVEYKGNSWHDECFTCFNCKRPIGTQSFLCKGNDIYCSPCYDKKFAKQCVSCKKVLFLTGERHHFFLYMVGKPTLMRCLFLFSSNCRTSAWGKFADFSLMFVSEPCSLSTAVWHDVHYLYLVKLC